MVTLMRAVCVDMNVWVVGWLGGWVVGLSYGWFGRWLNGWLCIWFGGWLVGGLFDRCLCLG